MLRILCYCLLHSVIQKRKMSKDEGYLVLTSRNCNEGVISLKLVYICLIRGKYGQT